MADISVVKLPNNTAYTVKDATGRNITSTHVADSSAHVSSYERESWNSKVAAYMDENNSTTLVLDADYEGSGDGGGSSSLNQTELTDIRIGADNTTYSSAGNAVRS